MMRFLRQAGEGFAMIGRQKWAQAVVAALGVSLAAALFGWIILHPFGWFMVAVILLILAADPGPEEGEGDPPPQEETTESGLPPRGTE